MEFYLNYKKIFKIYYLFLYSKNIFYKKNHLKKFNSINFLQNVQHNKICMIDKKLVFK